MIQGNKNENKQENPNNTETVAKNVTETGTGNGSGAHENARPEGNSKDTRMVDAFGEQGGAVDQEPKNGIQGPLVKRDPLMPTENKSVDSLPRKSGEREGKTTTGSGKMLGQEKKKQVFVPPSVRKFAQSLTVKERGKQSSIKIRLQEGSSMNDNSGSTSIKQGPGINSQRFARPVNALKDRKDHPKQGRSLFTTFIKKGAQGKNGFKPNRGM